MDRRWRIWLLGIVAISLLLNLWGIGFGLPERWHPDEITGEAVAMAREFSLNPHVFRYGSLHYYQVLAVIVPTYLVSAALGLDHDSVVTVVVLAARALSALLGAGCVALTFLLAWRLFDRTTAILSASFLAVAVGLVTNAHFATVDVPMMFWMMASYLMAAEVLLTGRRRAYLLGGLFAGLAAATKYPGATALLCLPVAHLLAGAARDHRALLLGLGASALAFLVANPTLFLASCEFFEGIIRDNAFSATQGLEDAIARTMVVNLWRGLGGPLFILVGLSLIYALRLLADEATRPKILLIAAMIIPSVLLLLELNANYVRFVLPLFPPLMVLAGKATADLIAARSAHLRFAGATVAAAAIVVSVLHAVAVDLAMIHDSRTLALDWVEQNVLQEAKIEITSYVKSPNDDLYQVVRRPTIHGDYMDDNIVRLENSAIYKIMQPLYLTYKEFAEEIGICCPKSHHYRGWYDRTLVNRARASETFDLSLAGLQTRAPDILMVSEFYYNWHMGPQSGAEGEFFADLFAGKSSYRQVAAIRYQALPWPNPMVEFINPTIWIFQRAD